MQLSAIFVLLAISADAQQLPDAAALLQQAGSALKARKSYRYVSDKTVNMEVSGNPVKMTITSTIAAMNPNKVRVESKASMGGGATIVSDGEFTWTYLPMLKQYTRKAALGGLQAVMQGLGIDKMPNAASMTQATRTVRAESVDVDGEKRDCWVLETRLDRLPLPAPPGAELTDVVMTRWLDKLWLMDLRSEMTGKMDAGPMKANMRQEMSVHGIKFDESLADSLFTFTPPDGAREVNEIAGLSTKKSDLVGKVSPEFHLKSMENRTLDFAELKGKLILLDFWTTWCAPCRKDMPVLEKIYNEQKGEGLLVIGVNGNEEREVVEKFLQTEHISYPIVLPGSTDLLPRLEISAFPTYVLIGSDGKIAGHQIGSQGEQALYDLLARAGLTFKPAKKQ